MMKKKLHIFRVVYILSSLLMIQILSPIFISGTQSNLVENPDGYTIFHGNFGYNLIIPKDEGSIVSFEKNDQKIIKMSLKYLSEYESSGFFMNSEENLDGKSYQLEFVDWSTEGLASPARISVNSSSYGLSENATINFSTNIYNLPTEIRGTVIDDLSPSYLEFIIENWKQTSDVSGLAINLLLEVSKISSYKRVGPYFDFEEEEYVLSFTFGSEEEFQLRFVPFVKVLTTDDTLVNVDSMVFADYNIAVEKTQPADFWISIPYIVDAKKIIIGFEANFPSSDTTQSSNISTPFLLISTFTMILFIIIIKKRK